MKAFRRSFLFPIALILILALPPLRTGAQTPVWIDGVYWFDWSGNGTKIAIANGNGISIYDSDFQLLAFRPQPDPNTARSIVSLSPDGTKLATENEIWETDTLATLVQFTPDVILGQWNSDGSQIATIAQNLHDIVIYDTTTGSLIKTITLDGSQIIESPPMWSPDDTRFVVVDRFRIITLVDAIQGTIIARYTPQDSIIGNPIWSPDGTKLAFSGFAHVAPGTSGSIPHEDSQTGAILNSINVMNVSNGQILRMVAGLPQSPNAIIWSPDGAQILGMLGSSVVYIWDVETGQLIDSYKSGEHLTKIVYSPFGGQFMAGTNRYRNISSTGLEDIVPQSTFTKSLFNGVIKLAVPAPSAARIQNILSRCITNAETLNHLNSQLVTAQYPDFIAAIHTLPADQIPPACAADVIAIAEILNTTPAN